MGIGHNGVGLVDSNWKVNMADDKKGKKKKKVPVVILAELEYEVPDDGDGTSDASADRGRSGPAQVSSEAFRIGHDRIFGNKKKYDN